MSDKKKKQITEHSLPSKQLAGKQSTGTVYYSLFTVHCRKGFTLIELMVVMIILGLLAALVVPKMVHKSGQAKPQAAYAQIELFGTALDLFALEVGRYPSTSEGLEALISQPAGVDDWKGPYLKKTEVPLDPWGKQYHYESPGRHGDYDLYSYGRDGTEGGEGEDQDLASWKGIK